MSLGVNDAIVLSKSGTATGRFSAVGLKRAALVAIEIVAEVVGGTPALTFTIQGLKPGGDPATAGDWNDLNVVVADTTTASTKTPSIAMSVGRTVFYVEGLDKRFFDGFALNVTADTNVTFRSNLYAL